MKTKIVEVHVPQSAEAFSLAEVCISTALVSTLVVGLYAGIASGFAYTKALRENLRATQVMLERLEGIRLYNWTQVNSNGFIPTTFTEYYYPNLGGTNGGSGVMYTGSVSIASANLYPPASYSSDMRLVTVRVGWLTTQRGTNGIVHKRSMRTYVGRNGLQNYVFNN